MAMQLDHEQLHRLLTALADSDIQEFRLEGDDFRLEVRRNLPINSIASQGVSSRAVDSLASTVSVPRVDTSNSAAVSPPPPVPASRTDVLEITAPMVGTFYRAPAPDDPPFVEIGSRISSGQTVCILEAMKLMNELEAEVSGEVVEILIENGTPVEFGQVLMRIKPS